MLFFLVIFAMIFFLAIQWLQAMMLFLLMFPSGLVVPNCDDFLDDASK
jgi:hypothetical protein